MALYKLTKFLRYGQWLWRSWQNVASNTRGPGFKSSDRQLLLNIHLLLTICRKDENKEKEAGNGPFLKKFLRCGAKWSKFAVILKSVDNGKTVLQNTTSLRKTFLAFSLVLETKFFRNFERSSIVSGNIFQYYCEPEKHLQTSVVCRWGRLAIFFNSIWWKDFA